MEIKLWFPNRGIWEMVKSWMTSELADPLPIKMQEGESDSFFEVVLQFDTEYNKRLVEGFLTPLQHGFKIVAK